MQEYARQKLNIFQNRKRGEKNDKTKPLYDELFLMIQHFETIEENPLVSLQVPIFMCIS